MYKLPKLEVQCESLKCNCKEEKAWVVWSFHSSFKERLLDEFLDGFLMNYWMNVILKVYGNEKKKHIKKMQETR